MLTNHELNSKRLHIFRFHHVPSLQISHASKRVRIIVFKESIASQYFDGKYVRLVINLCRNCVGLNAIWHNS